MQTMTREELRIPRRRAQRPTTRMVSFRSGNQDLEAYLAHPEGEGPFPGVMVIHESSA